MTRYAQWMSKSLFLLFILSAANTASAQTSYKKAAEALIKRIIPEKADQTNTEIISTEQGKEMFEIYL